MSCGDEAIPMPPDENDALPTVSLEGINVLEGNTSEKSIFASIRLSKSSDTNIEVLVESIDGTAKADEDYRPVSMNVVFAAGAVQENIKLDIIGDEMSEVDEYFTLRITSATGATIGVEGVRVTIENDDQGNGVVAIPSTGYTTPEAYASMDLIWSDEFSGTELDQSNWTYEIGNGSSGWGNNELQFYRKENTSIVDGNLVIAARDETFNGFKYTSSRLITKDKFEFTHGRVDIRAVIPEGQGIWPALWMLGANISEVGWPRCGEIDIMELVGHEPSKVHATVHYPNANGDRLLNGTSTDLTGGKKFSDEFHVFSLVWEEDRIKIYLDDKLYYNSTRTSLGVQNPYPFNEPFFFIMNVAVGGNWPGSPDASTLFPQNMIVDYIRVFQPK